MSIDALKRVVWFVILCIVQALVLNNIHLFNCATPLLYVYFVIIFPLNYPKWGLLLWSFMLGLVIDMFSNTPGEAAASLTLIGAIQPYFFQLFVQRDAPEDIKPSLRSIGHTKFLFYAFVIVFIYCLVFFTLESFNFFNWLQWLESVLGSTLITFILIITIESVKKK